MLNKYFSGKKTPELLALYSSLGSKYLKVNFYKTIISILFCTNMKQSVLLCEKNESKPTEKEESRRTFGPSTYK
jgi:hypothetical protein